MKGEEEASCLTCSHMPSTVPSSPQMHRDPRIHASPPGHRSRGGEETAGPKQVPRAPHLLPGWTPDRLRLPAPRNPTSNLPCGGSGIPWEFADGHFRFP